MRSLVRRFFVAIVALLLLFEEWGWEPLAALLARLGRLPFFAWLEDRIRRLPPYAAVAAFFAPALLLVPVKLAALWFIAGGHSGLGIMVLVAAKIAGTAIVARLFALTQATLMQLSWFAHWYPRWKAWKDRLMDEVKRSPGWRSVMHMKDSVRARWAQFRKSLG